MRCEALPLAKPPTWDHQSSCQGRCHLPWRVCFFGGGRGLNNPGLGAIDKGSHCSYLKPRGVSCTARALRAAPRAHRVVHSIVGNQIGPYRPPPQEPRGVRLRRCWQGIPPIRSRTSAWPFRPRLGLVTSQTRGRQCQPSP